MAAFRNKYVLPPALQASFKPEELKELKDNFGMFDENGDGTIDGSELAKILAKMGEPVTVSDIQKYLQEADSDGDGKISFAEFAAYVNSIRSAGGAAGAKNLASIVTKAQGMLKVEGAGGAQHTFSEEEKIAFSEHINHCLSVDPLCSRLLPIDPHSMQLFEKTGDGILLCKLINLAQADTIDERAMNKKEGMNVYQKTENLNLVINAAKAIGCQVINIGAQDLIEGRPILVLGLVWQIIKIQLTCQISLKNYPELILLLEPDEELASLLRLPPEDILLRWFNYHLRRAGTTRRVTNFGNDIKDSECYSLLLNQLKPAVCDHVTESDAVARAQHVINNAKALGAQPFLSATDITTGNKKLNLGFVAQLFNTCPGLYITQEELSSYDFAGLDLDDSGDSREERVFRMWINSLNLNNVYLNELFSGVHDGVAILRVEDHLEPGCINWKRVNIDPVSRFKKVENGNMCVDVGKQFKFSLVGIGGVDIVDQKKKLILALIWQLMRKHTLQVLKKLAVHENVAEMTEDHIINWANRKVAASGKRSTMRSFRDSDLSNGLFFLDLVAAIEPRAVNWDLVTPGSTPEEKLSNAKYSISIARKIGACVFLTPEDITEVKSKMLMTFAASLWATDLTYVRA
jgi:plastin-1